jgi:hypothetical protein
MLRSSWLLSKLAPLRTRVDHQYRDYDTDWTTRVQIPGRDNDVIFSLRHWSTEPPIKWVSGAPTQEIKRLGREADHSPPSSAVINNAWSYTSNPNTYLWRRVQGQTFLSLPHNLSCDNVYVCVCVCVCVCVYIYISATATHTAPHGNLTTQETHCILHNSIRFQLPGIAPNIPRTATKHGNSLRLPVRMR